ncbi:MAG: hypothetical protein Q8L48_17210 [Archangium sp.]|nr:hypothetical protein [Archangium sp.]
MSTSFVLKLSPGALENPDLDLRYDLPDAIAAQSGGRIQTNGYDYDDGVGPSLLLFLVAQAPGDLSLILTVLDSGPMLGNDLRETPVAVEDGGICSYVHPPRLVGTTFRLRKR